MAQFGPNGRPSFIGLVSKSELFSKRSNYQSARSAIQHHARQVFMSSGLPRACRVCGYSLHFEVAHIKAVSSFPGATLVDEINHIANLVPLCPNHHWEHDNGLLDFS